MTDPFVSQLSAYLDAELDGAGRAALELHLAQCQECQAVLADLRAIVAAAPHYSGAAPARELWNGIAARLGEAEVIPLSSRRPRFGWSQLIAASLLLAAVGGGLVWVALRNPTNAELAVTPTAAPPSVERNAAFAEQKYEGAVRDLEQLLAMGRGQLDTATVRTIEQSLAKIDSALAEARSAIQRDPQNGYLSRQIAANMRLKLNLLRAATNAIAAKT